MADGMGLEPTKGVNLYALSRVTVGFLEWLFSAIFCRFLFYDPDKTYTRLDYYGSVPDLVFNEGFYIGSLLEFTGTATIIDVARRLAESEHLLGIICLLLPLFLAFGTGIYEVDLYSNMVI